ncbi:PPE domain-containing protein [Amycolatopsis sp. MtRt-6]|uniref:WXG100 family type VII secretion target n=1 Tax=Amycolatopsis sp. MtRt-6 TaxID=2792782 RepID=UPI0027DE66C5|nr:PPE domain-containing protein [Amycolatopsis sp. MtRt-6]
MWHDEFRRRLLRPPAAASVPADGLELRPFDGVPMTVWENVSHEQMTTEVTTNANPAAIAESAREWLRIADELQQHERALRRAIEESRGDWQGAGGDAVRRHAAKVADWLATTARGALLAGRQQQVHAQALEEARRRMAANPPVGFSAAEANARLQGITDPAAYARQLAEDTRLRDAQEVAHAEAVRIMTEFDRALAQAVVTPFFAAPPELPGVPVRSGLSRDAGAVAGVPGIGEEPVVAAAAGPGAAPPLVTSGAGGVTLPDSTAVSGVPPVRQPDAVAGVPPLPGSTAPAGARPDAAGVLPGSTMPEGARLRSDAVAGVPRTDSGAPEGARPDSGGVVPGSRVPEGARLRSDVAGVVPGSTVPEGTRSRSDAAAGVPPFRQPDSTMPDGVRPLPDVAAGESPDSAGLRPRSDVVAGVPPFPQPDSTVPGGVPPHSGSTGVSGARFTPPIPPIPAADPAVAVPPLPADPPAVGGTGGPGRGSPGPGMSGLGGTPRRGPGDDTRRRPPRLGSGAPGGALGDADLPPAGSGFTGSAERSGPVRDSTPAGAPEPSRSGQQASAPLTGIPRAGGKPAEDEEHRVADYLEADPELFAAEQPPVPPTLGDWKKNKNWRKQP